MGCCLSTGGASSTGKDPNFPEKIESFNQKPKFENRAPPPSFEEETVKEVLSEISKPKPIFPVPRVESENRKVLEAKPAVVEKIPEEESISFNKVVLKSPASTTLSAGIDDSEDVSEICSLSETVSTITDRRDEEEEVRQQRVFRSPARIAPPPRRDRVVGRSPSKRPDPSTRRRIPNPNSNPTAGGGPVRMARSRESGQPMGRPGSRPSPTRRDPGESSERRSRSPAVNRSLTGRSPSVKRANQSPARVRAESVEIENGRKLVPENANSSEKWPSSHQNVPNSAPNESLDNPLVSLECFIFL